MKSKLTTHQTLEYYKTWTEDGDEYQICVKIRYDDECNNGHNTFAITGAIYRNSRHWSGGCIHDDIEKHFPEFAHLIKWHLCSSDGPLHYPGNVLYHARARDCWGLLEGEKRQIINGRSKLPSWVLSAMVDGEAVRATVSGVDQYKDSADQPDCPVDGLVYAPWYRVGEGKEINIEGARSCAVWPDATLEQLQDEKALMDRLPGLLEEMRHDIEALGMEW